MGMSKIAIVGVHNLHLMQFLYKYTDILDSTFKVGREYRSKRRFTGINKAILGVYKKMQ